MTRFSMDVIASTAFGIEAHAFSEPDGVFTDMVRTINTVCSALNPQLSNSGV